MAKRMDSALISNIELKALAELAASGLGRDIEPESTPPLPEFKSSEEEKEWRQAQGIERDRRRRQAQLRQVQAESEFQKGLVDLLKDAFEAGAQRAVSTEARRAVTVRGYVLLGVVAAVVSMPLIGMLLKLNPDTFGAFIAPVTGIAGTIVGYWFGTVGQVSGQGTIQPPERTTRQTE